MGITFGFITDGNNDQMLEAGIASVINSKIENSEILVVGNTKLKIPGVKVIPFDESKKAGWITKKKNLVASHSKNSILVILHDYLILSQGWNSEVIHGFLEGDWDVAVCKIRNVGGDRFRDLVVWPFNHRILKWPFTYNLRCLLPYSSKPIPNLMYINGTVLITKREYLLENPLDEERGWGQGEDVEWSIRLRDEWVFKYVPELLIESLKNKDAAFLEMGIVNSVFIRAYSFLFQHCSPPIRKFLTIPYS